MRFTMKAHRRLGDSIQVFQVRPADFHLRRYGCRMVYCGSACGDCGSLFGFVGGQGEQKIINNKEKIQKGMMKQCG